MSKRTCPPCQKGRAYLVKKDVGATLGHTLLRAIEVVVVGRVHKARTTLREALNTNEMDLHNSEKATSSLEDVNKTPSI